MRRSRRAVALLLSLFVAALGWCTSLEARAEAVTCPVAAPSSGSPCCPIEEGESCPLSQAPSGTDCRLCDRSVQLQTATEIEALARPGAESVTRLDADSGARTLRDTGARQRMRLLGESPPLNLLNRTFRN